jgi:hypothetical protein
MLVNKDGVISIMPEAKKDPYVKAIRERKDFQNIINFAYYCYNPQSPYHNVPIKEREAFVLSNYTTAKRRADLIYGSAEKFFDHYQRVILTPSERYHNKLLKDIDELLERLSNIPVTRIEKIEISIDIPRSADSTEMVKYPIKQKLEIDNSKEKLDAIKMTKELLEYKKVLEKEMETEKFKKGHGGKTLVE